MENQGRRPDQIKFSEQVTFYSIIGIIVILLIAFLTK